MYTLVVPFLSTKFIKIDIRICHFSQYLEAKFDMLFEITTSVEKQLSCPKILDFMPKDYSIALST